MPPGSEINDFAKDGLFSYGAFRHCEVRSNVCLIGGTKRLAITTKEVIITAGILFVFVRNGAGILGETFGGFGKYMKRYKD